MGTTVQSKNYLPGYCPMRDLNEDANSCGWPLYCGDRNLSNGQYCNGFAPTTMGDPYPMYDKDVVKRTMLEHEAIFKNQVYELHRLYRKQKDIMDEMKRKELQKGQSPVGTLASSSPLQSEFTSEDARKWNIPGFHTQSASSARRLISCVEDCHSPMSIKDRNTSENRNFVSQNRIGSKDVEVKEVRPMKVRRKLIDLHLPADEYIDMDEIGELKDNASCGNPRKENQTGEKLEFGESARDSHHKCSLGSASGFRSYNGLADLNEPIDVPETSTYETEGHEPLKGIKVQPFGLTKEISHSSTYRRNNMPLNNVRPEENAGQRGWLYQVLGAGNDKSSQKSVSRDPNFSSHDLRKLDLWGGRASCDLGTVAGALEISHDSHVESSVASNGHGSHQTISPDFVRSWNHWLWSWENASCSLSKKLAHHKSSSVLNSSETFTSTQAAASRHRLFGDRWHPDSNSRTATSYETGCYGRNGFYQGSSSRSKEFPSNFSLLNYSHPNSRSDGNAALEHPKTHTTANIGKDLNNRKSHFPKDVNLNVAYANGERHREENVFSSLRDTTGSKNKMTNGHRDANQVGRKRNIGEGLNHLCGLQGSASVPWSNSENGQIEPSDCPRNRKILGIPIFDKPNVGKAKPSSNTFFVSGENEIMVKGRLLDINLPCEPPAPALDQHGTEVLATEKELEKKDSGFRPQIDLNMSLSEDEDPFAAHSHRAKSNLTSVIDLESPAVPEHAEYGVSGERLPEKAQEEPSESQKLEKDENILEELIKTAAEAIVDLSSSAQNNHSDEPICSSSEPSDKNALHWLAATIHACGDDLERKVDAYSHGKESGSSSKGPSEEVDDFESMTLKLAEVTEEEYMPKPLVPEDLQLEEMGPSVIPTRPRRGQARRGRQRRDFQRDILPGLVSLSRHEVTEDLQTFGGLMRATGYSWSSGLTRRNGARNGSNRGRRRSVNNTPPAQVQRTSCPVLAKGFGFSNVETRVEDRSLRGWGKTTRRPRRQRCPAGNLSPVILT